jgi:hypothetical protein
MLACWGALGRRLNLVVYMYKYEYRFKDAGGATPGQQRGGDNCVSSVGRARALLELVLPLFKQSI